MERGKIVKFESLRDIEQRDLFSMRNIIKRLYKYVCTLISMLTTVCIQKV